MLRLIRQAFGRAAPDLSADQPAPREPAAPPAPLPDPGLTLSHLHAVLDHLRPGADASTGPALADQRAMLTGLTLPLTAGQMMVESPLTAAPQTDWRNLTALLTQHRLRSIPIVDGQNRLLGVVPVDLLLRPGASGLTAAHLMLPAHSLPVTATLPELLAAFANSTQPALPITADGKLVGVLTRTDILSALIRIL